MGGGRLPAGAASDLVHVPIEALPKLKRRKSSGTSERGSLVSTASYASSVESLVSLPDGGEQDLVLLI